MKHKDSEEMLSGVTLLEVYSHIHTVMKEKSKKEVEGEMRILQQLLEDEGRGGGGVEGGGDGSEWQILSAGFTRGNMMDSYEYCMI